MIIQKEGLTYSEEELIQFVKEFSGARKIEANTDLESTGITGDDFDELMEAYSLKFGVNMQGYLWYFHSREEGQNLGSIFFKSPDQRVNRIAVTPVLLTRFANSGKWAINYPEHKLPSVRWDTWIGIAIIAIITLLFIFF